MNLERVRGVRDFMPKEMILREDVVEKFKKIFKKYGFLPLDTPALEKWELLSSKYAGGAAILEETYNFKDKSGRRIGLRYDLTVPIARVIAMNPDLTMPFKRYQYSKVWRYQEIKPGRLREFYQMDIDTFGTKSMLADAEVIACSIECFKELGFKKFTVRINNRKILESIVKYAGVEKKNTIKCFRAIDKLDKAGLKGVKKELKNYGIKQSSINKIMPLLKIKGSPETVFKKAKKFIRDKIGLEGIKELKEIISYLDIMKTEAKYNIDLSLVRGLDYYTGPIFEVSAEGLNVSFAGGGRFDEMISKFCGKEVPAVGISFGIEPITQVLEKKQKIKQTFTKIYVIPIGNTKEKALEITQKLRKTGISVEMDLMEKNISKNLKYINKKGIPYSLIIGPKDLRENQLTVKNMETGKEEKIDISSIVEYFLIRK